MSTTAPKKGELQARESRPHRVLANRKNLTTDEWLDLRAGDPPEIVRLGGSDASAALGVNRYKSPYQLWLEKSGKAEPDDISGLSAVKAGNYLEEPIIEWASDEMGWNVQRRYQILQHAEHDFMTANVDAEIVDHEDGLGLLEIKSTHGRNEDDWYHINGDGEKLPSVPPEALAQVHHYMAVKRYDFAYVAALIGGQDLQIRRVDYDAEFVDMLIEQEREFVQKLREDEAPEVDGSDSCRQALYKSMDINEDEVEVDDQEAASLVERYDELKDRIGELKGEKDEVMNKLVDTVGEHEAAKIVTDDGRRTFRNITATRENVDKDTLKEEYPEIANELISDYSYTYPRLY